MPTTNYDLDNLTNTEVQTILSELKNPKNKISFSDMYNQISTLFFIGAFEKDQIIIQPGDDIEYNLHIRQGKYENRYSIHLRFLKNNIHLVRLDIGSTHINPDGEHIDCDHIHIYANSASHSKTTAIPLDNSDFPNITTFIDALDKFLQYTHIQ